MSIGGQRPLPNLCEQVCYIGGITQRDTQSECINEETDQMLKFMIWTISNRCADNNVVLTTETGKNNTPGRQ
ncbi:hypothetical protein Xcab_04301 [Xenorhabdus cabanillasii JM26]|nr:hypothetical protein Xcab_04301 [Xenorhabdus cabanillasii JM26]